MDGNLLLEVVAGNDPGRKILVPPEGAVLGRSPHSDIILQETTISRKHCRIALEQGQWVIQDLGSTHGVVVDDKRVEKCVLPKGSVIQLGELKLHVEPTASDTRLARTADTPIRFKCRCGQEYAVKSWAAGKEAVCKSCGATVVVPAPSPP